MKTWSFLYHHGRPHYIPDANEKKPATRKLIKWVRALCHDPDFKPK